uniref:Uncharacterized protein n=1 Tax=Fagus sylvatica TaxID=28930 RepID=A0A2N9J5A9_FAGSY
MAAASRSAMAASSRSAMAAASRSAMAASIGVQIRLNLTSFEVDADCDDSLPGAL